MPKRLLQEIRPYVNLFINDNTGIAWVEDGSTGNSHSAHPNIDATGSVRGMKKLGYWGKNDITLRCNGAIYNTSKLVVTDELDMIAARHCKCELCLKRKGDIIGG